MFCWRYCRSTLVKFVSRVFSKSSISSAPGGVARATIPLQDFRGNLCEMGLRVLVFLLALEALFRLFLVYMLCLLRGWQGILVAGILRCLYSLVLSKFQLVMPIWGDSDVSIIVFLTYSPVRI